MSRAVYDKGDVARITLAIRTAAGVAADPGALIFRYRKPGGTTTTLTYGIDGALVKDSVGNYHVDLDLDTASIWYYRWQATGANAGAREGEFDVRASNF